MAVCSCENVTYFMCVGLCVHVLYVGQVANDADTYVV